MVNRLVLNLCNSVNMQEDNVYRSRSGLVLPPPTQGTIGNIGGPIRTVEQTESDDFYHDEHTDQEDLEYDLSSGLRNRSARKEIELSMISDYSRNSRYLSAQSFSEDMRTELTKHW